MNPHSNIPTITSGGAHQHGIADVTGLQAALDAAGGGGSVSAWGDLTGTLSDQTDLQSALDAKADTTHTHEADDIVSGVIGPTFLGTGTSISTKYLRGDGTWQTLGAGVTDLDGLSDVAITTPANKHALIHNGTSFVNRALVVADISDLVEASTCQIKVIDDATTLTTGDGKFIFAIPSELNGYNLTAAIAFVTTVSSSGTPTIQIRNVTQAADMLTTRITIDANEYTSSTAAAAAVIDTANDDVAAYDLIAIDVDVAGTGAKGLGLILTFTKP